MWKASISNVCVGLLSVESSCISIFASVALLFHIGAASNTPVRQVLPEILQQLGM